jgi:hypothetical protein
MTRRKFFAALVALAATASVAAPGDQARLDYRIDGPTRHVRGTSRELDWDVVALADGAFAFRVLVPVDSLASDDPAFDAALRKATASQDRPYLAIRGIARRDRFEGKLLVANFERPISLPVSTSHADGFLSATVSAEVDPSRRGIAGFGPGTKLTVTFRVPASGNAVLAGGSSRAVN